MSLQEFLENSHRLQPTTYKEIVSKEQGITEITLLTLGLEITLEVVPHF
jgi:hypothetical protein